MKTKLVQRELAKKLPGLFTYHPAADHFLPGFRWAHNRMHVDLNSLDTMHAIEQSMPPEDRDWFKTELWRAATDDMPKPLTAESHQRANRELYSAKASHRLKAILKTLRLFDIVQ